MMRLTKLEEIDSYNSTSFFSKRMDSEDKWGLDDVENQFTGESSFNPPPFISSTFRFCNNSIDTFKKKYVDAEEDLITLMSRQLNNTEGKLLNVQQQLLMAEEELSMKDSQISALKQKVSRLENPPSNEADSQMCSSSANNVPITYLAEKCKRLEKQVTDMEVFFRDYGLVWVGDDEDIDDCPNHISSEDPNLWYVDQSMTPSLENGVDFNHLMQNIEELNLIAGKGEAQMCYTSEGATFQRTENVQLFFYANGLILFSGPFRPYSDPSTQLFLQDILDGYFPSELQHLYPDGVPFQVIDNRSITYEDPRTKWKAFSGTGYRLGYKSSTEQHDGSHALDNTESCDTEPIFSPNLSHYRTCKNHHQLEMPPSVFPDSLRLAKESSIHGTVQESVNESTETEPTLKLYCPSIQDNSMKNTQRDTFSAHSKSQENSEQISNMFEVNVNQANYRNPSPNKPSSSTSLIQKHSSSLKSDNKINFLETNMEQKEIPSNYTQASFEKTVSIIENKRSMYKHSKPSLIKFLSREKRSSKFIKENTNVTFNNNKQESDESHSANVSHLPKTVSFEHSKLKRNTVLVPTKSASASKKNKPENSVNTNLSCSSSCNSNTSQDEVCASCTHSTPDKLTFSVITLFDDLPKQDNFPQHTSIHLPQIQGVIENELIRKISNCSNACNLDACELSCENTSNNVQLRKSSIHQTLDRVVEVDITNSNKTCVSKHPQELPVTNFTQNKNTSKSSKMIRQGTPKSASGMRLKQSTDIQPSDIIKFNKTKFETGLCSNESFKNNTSNCQIKLHPVSSISNQNILNRTTYTERSDNTDTYESFESFASYRQSNNVVKKLGESDIQENVLPSSVNVFENMLYDSLSEQKSISQVTVTEMLDGAENALRNLKENNNSCLTHSDPQQIMEHRKLCILKDNNSNSMNKTECKSKEPIITDRKGNKTSNKSVSKHLATTLESNKHPIDLYKETNCIKHSPTSRLPIKSKFEANHKPKLDHLSGVAMLDECNIHHHSKNTLPNQVSDFSSIKTHKQSELQITGNQRDKTNHICSTERTKEGMGGKVMSLSRSVNNSLNGDYISNLKNEKHLIQQSPLTETTRMSMSKQCVLSKQRRQSLEIPHHVHTISIHREKTVQEFSNRKEIRSFANSMQSKSEFYSCPQEYNLASSQNTYAKGSRNSPDDINCLYTQQKQNNALPLFNKSKGSSASQRRVEPHSAPKIMTSEQLLKKLPPVVIRNGKVVPIRTAVAEMIQIPKINAPTRKEIVSESVKQNIANVQISLKVRVWSGNEVFLICISPDETVGKLRQMLDNALFPSKTAPGYHILAGHASDGNIPLTENSFTLRQYGLVHNSVIYLQKRK